MRANNLRIAYTANREYVWYSYRSGKTEDEEEILEMLSECGLHFSAIGMSETHDLGDEEWYSGYFRSLEELKADEAHKRYICEWNAQGEYDGIRVEVYFHGWNIFGGVHIQSRTKEEAVLQRLLKDFERVFLAAAEE